MDKNLAYETLMSFVENTDNAIVKDAILVLHQELNECEDERIRKALIDGVRQIRCKNGITQEQMIAYLEKQKEQKPAEWNEEDEELAEDLIKLAEYYTNTEDETEFKPHIYWLKDLPKRFNLQPKQEWGEEDKKNRSPLKTKEIKVGDIITYFKNGKNGIMLVSSFDAGIYPRCKWGITDIDGTAYGDWAPGSGPYYIATEKEKQQLYDTMPIEVKNCLKSLRPHPHWKSSDEQIMAPNTNTENEAL